MCLVGIKNIFWKRVQEIFSLFRRKQKPIFLSKKIFFSKIRKLSIFIKVGRYFPWKKFKIKLSKVGVRVEKCHFLWKKFQSNTPLVFQWLNAYKFWIVLNVCIISVVSVWNLIHKAYRKIKTDDTDNFLLWPKHIHDS